MRQVELNEKLSGEWLLLFNDEIIDHSANVEDMLKLAEEKYYKIQGVLANLQFRVIKKTGEIIWLEIISKNIPYEGRMADLVATLDITEKMKAERIVLEENKRLLELNKMRKDLIIRVSHELKTPLTSIYGASQILLKHLKEKGENGPAEAPAK